MKRFVMAGLTAVAVVSAMGASAQAADMARRQAVMPVKAPAYVPPYSWTGFYAGINAGGGWGRSSFSNALGTSGNFNTSGGVVGGTLGYNMQMGQAVFGIEGDLDWSNVRGSTASGICAGTSCEARNNWLGTARGRIGYAFDRFLPYVTGGLALGDVKSSVPGFGSNTTTKAGYALGGGMEVAVAGPWTAKVEYLYTDLGRASGVAGTDVKFRENLVRGGVNYRF